MKGLLEICYLIGSVTFIIGLKMMGNAKTARKGNLIGAFGMTIAILGTIFLFRTDHTTVNKICFNFWCNWHWFGNWLVNC